jgi:hypothetical protein
VLAHESHIGAGSAQNHIKGRPDGIVVRRSKVKKNRNLAAQRRPELNFV